MAYHLAAGTTFLGIAPPRPLRVLYVDFESHDGVFEEHLTKIGTHPNLHFVELADDPLRGPDFVTALTEVVNAGHYDVVIVDSLVDAYPVLDENDNGAAVAQMHAFRGIARGTRAAVVLVHNIGQRGQELKNDSQDDNPFLGRGATARPDRADVVLNFLYTGERRRRITVPKSRQSNKGERIHFCFAGQLGYELESPAVGTTVLAERADEKMARQLVELVRQEHQAGEDKIRRETLRQRIGLSKSAADRRALSRALKRALHIGLALESRGVYVLAARPAAEAAAAA